MLSSLTNLTSMQSYFGFFLKTEVTFIPRLLDKYLGDYYNNTLCNGATWMFATWFVLHVSFDALLDALLRKMRFQKYIRTRMQRSLWYLGFYATACLYCAATLHRNQLHILKMGQPFDGTDQPSGHLILGFIVMLTFYLHSAFWEGVKYQDITLFLSHLSLFLFLCLSYFLRFVEGSFRLNVVVCVTHVMLELSRCLALLRGTKVKTRVVAGNFVISILVFLVNYVVVIPVLFGYPLLKDYSSSVGVLLSILALWLLFEAHSSVFFKAVWHYLRHTSGDGCGKDVYECSLFPPRSDATFAFLRLQEEMKQRRDKSVAGKRPKGRNVVFQTLKCMVAMKRKLKERRRSAESPQDENGLVVERYTDDVSPEEVVDGKIAFRINGGKSKQE